MARLIPETARKIFTPETLRSAAKQSTGCLVIPVRLRRAIKRYLRENEGPHMKRKVLRLSQSFSEIKDLNLMLTESTSKELVEDPLKSTNSSKRWKIKSAYGDIGLLYSDDETIAYVASRMPSIFSACYRVLSEVQRRIPDFSPAKVLDFGAGTGSAFWAMREVWPKSIENVNLVEPSQSMQRAGRSLIQGMKKLPVIHSYDSIQALSKRINKSDREHDLVIASYVLGEIPSLKDRVTVVRQLWNLTRDVLVIIEPGTPHGSNIISQMRSHVLWLEKRKCRKSKGKNNEACKDFVSTKSGAFIVAPCSHDGQCPLAKTGKYCHFAQRFQRTSSQHAYKRTGRGPLRGFEDEKFSFIAFRRGQRPREPWPLDGVNLETLKEQRGKQNLEDTEIDYEDVISEVEAEDVPHEAEEEEEEEEEAEAEEEVNSVNYDSDVTEPDTIDLDEESEDKRQEETGDADLGGGWGRILFMPVLRGRQVTLDVCRSVNRESSEGTLERIVVTRSKNPALHQLGRKSLWGDLWPF
ncbi:hypothetical protein K2173_010338 [Erythroxylum novogranatense]|uniref:Methyltransferase-like protein 17, mitochondrial n=1 Tax=Erythroxylum novogranatense TaxID=1862640 RepID=A0AAV8TF64_9ROSI|nr:hypothetical protein K2173_010338 [Erythroxylum novogranatense]